MGANDATGAHVGRRVRDAIPSVRGGIGHDRVMSDAVRQSTVTILSTRTLVAEAIVAELVAIDEFSPSRCTVRDEVTEPEGSEPGILVVDLDEPGAGGDDLLSFVRDHAWSRRVGIFDRFDARRAALAFDLGCVALCSLDSSVRHLVDAISGEVASSSTRAVGVTAAELQLLGSLSPREVEVLAHMVEGEATAEIAEALGIAVHTVQTHKRRAYAKLDVQSTAQAVALAVAGGIGRGDTIDEVAPIRTPRRRGS